MVPEGEGDGGGPTTALCVYEVDHLVPIPVARVVAHKECVANLDVSPGVIPCIAEQVPSPDEVDVPGVPRSLVGHHHPELLSSRGIRPDEGGEEADPAVVHVVDSRTIGRRAGDDGRAACDPCH